MIGRIADHQNVTKLVLHFGGNQAIAIEDHETVEFIFELLSRAFDFAYQNWSLTANDDGIESAILEADDNLVFICVKSHEPLGFTHMLWSDQPDLPLEL